MLPEKFSHCLRGNNLKFLLCYFQKVGMLQFHFYFFGPSYLIDPFVSSMNACIASTSLIVDKPSALPMLHVWLASSTSLSSMDVTHAGRGRGVPPRSSSPSPSPIPAMGTFLPLSLILDPPRIPATASVQVKIF